MAAYDRYYKEEQYFGKPYAGLMDFFRASARGTLVDLGAGQGRDSVPLADMGYQVTAVDGSVVGLRQITNANPAIQTVHADLYSFPVSPYDYILMDSILHFYRNDMEKETTLVQRIVSEMKPGAVLVNAMLQNAKAEKHLKDILSPFSTELVHEGYTDYPEFRSVFHLLAVLKTDGKP